MKIRSSLISESILAAVSSDEPDPMKRRTAIHRRIIRLVLSFFSLFRLHLARYRSKDFESLRNDVWRLDGHEYTESFQQYDDESGNVKDNKNNTRRLKPIGDLGYSGSSFFTTPNAKYLIKSLPRHFEHAFFTHDLLDPYIAHMRASPRSLLVRITDMVFTPHDTLGGVLGTAPTHHIIMENLLYGKDGAASCSDVRSGSSGSPSGPSGGSQSGDARPTDWHSMKWETYDLKPTDYFFPERDLADGRLAPNHVKDRLSVEFPDRVRVSAESKRQLLDQLETDTQLLADNNAIDYSLFLVRFPGPNARRGGGGGSDEEEPDAQAQRGFPVVPSDAGPWRTGMDDVDGRWTYRVVVLDFFWARHRFRPRALTGLVKAFNRMAHKGPMSITASPAEYRQRFLKMVDGIVVEA